ncbi:MAG: rhomboid family intramembrane serine protease [Pirellulaceae bacterium]
MNSGLVAIIETPCKRECNELRFVLRAVGISAQSVAAVGGWQLQVAGTDVDAACEELQEYIEERQHSDSDQAEMDSATAHLTEEDDSQQGVLLQSGGTRQAVGNFEGLFVFAILLIGFASLSWYSDASELMLEAGRSDARKVQAGQWWRATTALTLHSDSLHLCSNLVFGSLFGFLAGQLLGGGVAWMFIMLGGSLGNLANGFLRPVEHLSIGSSTAVFAALGIAIAHAVKPRLGAKSFMRRWSPLIAGIMLFTLVGTGGERTDVGAHATGLIAGLGLGAASTFLPLQLLSQWRTQVAAGTFAVLTIGLAWLLAVFDPLAS